MSFGDKLVEKLLFGRSGLNSSVFEKLFNSYSCILFIIQCALRSFCINLLCFSKIHFSRFLIDRRWFLTDRNCDKIFGLILPDLISARLMLDWSKLKNFQFLSFWPKIFFTHHLCLGFTCIAFFFSLYPSCSFAIISLIVFTHNMHALC